MSAVDEEAGPGGLARVPSGVPGLDLVTGGGFPRGGVYIVRGTPGAGKTILGHQICFAHIRDPARPGGGVALYATLLAEGHARMMSHLSGLRFFDPAAVPDRLYYVSAFRTLEEEGLRGLVGLMRREVARLGAGVAVLDGFVAVSLAARDDTEFKRFVHDLQAIAGATGCTVFLLTSMGSADPTVTPEQTMVDGIVELRRVPRGACRAAR